MSNKWITTDWQWLTNTESVSQNNPKIFPIKVHVKLAVVKSTTRGQTKTFICMSCWTQFVIQLHPGTVCLILYRLPSQNFEKEEIKYTLRLQDVHFRLCCFNQVCSTNKLGQWDVFTMQTGNCERRQTASAELSSLRWSSLQLSPANCAPASAASLNPPLFFGVILPGSLLTLLNPLQAFSLWVQLPLTGLTCLDVGFSICSTPHLRHCRRVCVCVLVRPCVCVCV